MPSDETRIQQLEARLKALKAQAAAQARRDETRRKIIYGAALGRHLKTLESDKCEALLKGLHRYVTRPADRKFLGLDE
ncbi:MAG: hypothetical protein KDK53_00985 [Maritimibacter sp.]|nr:hypothetical protein [Maritimibacter sp.]